MSIGRGPILGVLEANNVSMVQEGTVISQAWKKLTGRLTAEGRWVGAVDRESAEGWPGVAAEESNTIG